MSICAVVRCDRDAVARGLCDRCYARYRRGVSPVAPGRGYAVAEDKKRKRAEMTRRREAGEGIADIAAAVGVNTSTASRWLREWGVDVGNRKDVRPVNSWQPWTRDDIDFAVARTDLTPAERAAILGRTVSAVQELVRNMRED